MKKSILFLLSFLLISIFMLSGCEFNEIVKETLPQAKENAIQYIKDKYGVTAKVIGYETLYLPSTGAIPISKPSSEYIIHMKYLDKDIKEYNFFDVYIDGLSENTNGKDNYQFEDIKNDFKTYIEKLVGSKIESLQISYNPVTFSSGTVNNEYNFSSKYYDKADFTKFIYETDISAACIFVDNSKLFSESFADKLNPILNPNSKMFLINYKKELSHQYFDYINSYDTIISEEAPNINDALYINKSSAEVKYFSDYIVNTDSGISYYSREKNSGVILETTPANINGLIQSDEYAREYYNDYKAVSKTYLISNFDGITYLYVPTSKLDISSNKKYDFMILYSFNYDSTKEPIRKFIPGYFISQTNIDDTNGYICFELNLNSLKSELSYINYDNLAFTIIGKSR